jgi:hypothetical protein
VLEAMRHEYDQPLLDDFKTDVPLIPNYNFESYQHFVNHWMNWLNFRNSYIQFNLKANLEYPRPHAANSHSASSHSPRVSTRTPRTSTRRCLPTCPVFAGTTGACRSSCRSTRG